jgi:hypothetical protein
MIPRYRVLRERVEAELAEVRRAAGKARQAFDAAEIDSQQATFFLDSVAVNLHGFYSGIERIFEWIARELDGGLPTGSTWHRDLLTQMSLQVDGVRPAVIRSETARRLDAYLRFRHLVRNLYAWDFEAAKLADLVGGTADAVSGLEEDLAGFARFLEAASFADEI